MLPEAGEVVLDLLGSGHDGLNLLFGALALVKKQYLSTCIPFKQLWVEYNQFVWFSGIFFVHRSSFLMSFGPQCRGMLVKDPGEPEILVVLPSTTSKKCNIWANSRKYPHGSYLHRPCEGCWTAVPWISCWIRTSLGGLATVWINAIFTWRPEHVTVCKTNSLQFCFVFFF